MRRFIPLLFLLFCSGLSAQYVRIGDASYAGTIAGPFALSTTQTNYVTRFAYIFPRTVIGNIKHGDSITSLEFMRIAGNIPNSNTNLTLYVRNTSLSDFGTGKIYWPSEISTATKVFNQNPNSVINGSEGFQKIPFNITPYMYDTTKGDNFELLVEYKQTAIQPSVLYWYFEDGSTVSGYVKDQCKSSISVTANDSLGSGSDVHPTIVFNFPRYDKDVAVVKLYTLGKLPVPLGNPDSVQALVRNVGKKAQKGMKIAARIKGPNKSLKDTATFDIGLGEVKYIRLPSLNASIKGLDTFYASIAGDANTSNDTAISYRYCNENIYSYRDVTKSPDPGGIGFNGTTGDFVARFFSNKPKNINQITVNFAITGRPFKIGIWNTKSNNTPGNLVFLSDSLTTVGGNYILDLKTPVVVSGSFFVGVRQLNTNNVAFGYQTEDPPRPNTFFYTSPAGDTSWSDFYPDAPFKFLIEPRLQGDTDLTVTSADAPKDSIDMYVTDSVAPACKIANIGVKSILDSFRIYCEILQYGKSLYKRSIRDTISAGQKRSYTFPKDFIPKNFGEHEVWFYTRHAKDQIRDNDTLRRKFYVGVKKDVILQTVYEPSNGTVYEFNRDTFMPVAAVQNIGYDPTPTFVARCLIKKGKTVIYNQTQSLNLPKFQSKILAWPTYTCKDTGILDVYFITEMAGDRKRFNDTAVRRVYVSKTYDVGVDSIAVPDKSVFQTPGKTLRPKVHIYNDGIAFLNGARCWYTINSAYTTQVWTDTQNFVNLLGRESTWLFFNKTFTPTKKGLYRMVCYIRYPGDLIHSNDSLVININVGYPYDYAGISVLYPKITDTLSGGAGPYAPKMRVKNNGFVKNSDQIPVVFQIWKNSLRVYQDIKTVNADTGAISDITFASTFNPQNSGEYNIISFANYSSDLYRKNDTILSKFIVTVARDAWVKSIDTPLLSDEYHAKSSSIKPIATIENNGRLKIAPVRIYAEIYKGNTLLSYQFLDDSLEGYASKQLHFQTAFQPQDSGTYRLLVHTFSQKDQNIFNDSSTSFFRVTKGPDMKVVKWIQPLEANVYQNNTNPVQPGVELANIGTDTGKKSGTLYMRIWRSSGAQEMVSDTIAFSNIAMADKDTIYSAKSLSFATPDVYFMKAWLKNADNYPENDTITALYSVVLNGISNYSKHKVLAYPNPVKQTLWLNGDVAVTRVRISDASGKIVAEWEASSIQKADFGNLSKGIYLVSIWQQESITTIRVIKD